MQLDQRSLLIARTLTEVPSVRGKELEEMLGISRKQLSYSLNKINDYLNYRKVPLIKRSKSGHFHLDSEVIRAIKSIKGRELESSYIYSEKERFYVILLLLLNKKEELSMYHFISELGASKNTIHGDLKKLDDLIAPYDVCVFYTRKEGYGLLGSEFSKRAVLSMVIHKVLALPKGDEIIEKHCDFNVGRLNELIVDIGTVEEQLEARFTDEWLKELKYILYFILYRIEKENVLNELPEVFYHVVGTKEYTAILPIAQKYKVISSLEKIYLASTIQAANVHYLRGSELDMDDKFISSLMEVISGFEKIACVEIRDKNGLMDALLQHCKPSYYRMKYNYHIENSIMDMILPQHGYLHDMVKRSIVPFEEVIGMKLPDEELAYITALLGAWLKSEGKLQTIEEKKKALVVCTYGISVSNYLLVTLEELFPEISFIGCLSARDFLSYREDFDMVFSTVPLETEKIQFIIKNFSQEESKQYLREKVLRCLEGTNYKDVQVDELIAIIERHADNISRAQLSNDIKAYLSSLENRGGLHKKEARVNFRAGAPELWELLNEDTVMVTKETMLWEEAIRKAAEPLLALGKIEDRYLKKVINIIKEERPYILIGDGVVIPHAGIEDGALEVGMSLLKLPQRISINGYLEADIIIFLATPNTSIHLKALHKLNLLLENEIIINKIKEAQHSKELLRLLESYY